MTEDEKRPGAPEPVRVVGKYRVIREVGRGGMAVVYEATDTTLNRRVALKVLPQHLTHDKGFVARFRTEAQAAAALTHPNIVTIYEVGQEGDTHYIAMEFLENDLAGLIRAKGPLAVEEVVRISSQVAAGLEAAHSRGMVHRDVKPSNIMFDARGQAKVVDFGIVRVAEGTRLTGLGGSIGTPEYMSPEQAAGGTVDHRTDLYSLGIVAYEMLAGHAPFTASTPLAVAYMHKHEVLPDLRSRRPEVPEWLQGTLERCVAKAPEARWQNCGDLLESLRSQRVPAPASLASTGEQTFAPSAAPRVTQAVAPSAWPGVAYAPAPVTTVGGSGAHAVATTVAAVCAILLVGAGIICAILYTSGKRPPAMVSAPIPPPPPPPDKGKPPDEPKLGERHGPVPTWPAARESLSEASGYPNPVRSSGGRKLDELRLAIYNRELSSAELDDLTPEEVCILRNEPYGRNGHTFRSAHLRGFFADRVGYGGPDSGEPPSEVVRRLKAIGSYQSSRGGDWARHLVTPH